MKAIKNFVNLPPTGEDENWKQAVKIMAKGGNDNGGNDKVLCRENHGKLRHVLPTLHWVMMIWTRFDKLKTLIHL